MQARKDMLPCTFRGVGINGTYLGLARTSCPVLESGLSRYLKIRTVQNSDFSLPNSTPPKKITQAKKELTQARKDMLPCDFEGVGIIGLYLKVT